ncbi:CNNM domain-containing protein [Desulfopila inferna]|uniref:CNNM domain-containing protein n=1 Tax=Desulfopila inferna TaxID=468528 RepID=UPI001963275A|nr:HlyC/CorC family transporter [Desulfopila inferna]
MLSTLIIAVSLAIIISAFCSICEAVLYSISPSQVELLNKTGRSSGIILRNLRRDIDQPITAILTLNTVANTVGAAFAGAAVAKLYGAHSVLWFSASFTLSILILSEILPKTIGVTYSFRLAPLIAMPLFWMVFMLKPIIWLCRLITRLIPQQHSKDNISAEELQAIASLSLQSGEIDVDQARVINNVLILQSKMVRQVMTPRTVTFSLNEDNTVAEAMEQIQRLTSHSRVPIYSGEPDNVTGIIMPKEVLLAAARQQFDQRLSSLKQSVHFVPETAPLNRILIDFFDRRQHLFIVVDEYGSMTGVISMEDILEEIVGREIIDESDRALDMRELARKQTLESMRRRKNNI